MKSGVKCGLIWARLSPAGARLYAPRRGAGLQVTSSTAERSPFPSRGRTIARSKVSETANVEQRGNASLAGILKSRLNYVIRSLVSGLLIIRCSIFEIPPQLCYPVSGLWSLVSGHWSLIPPDKDNMNDKTNHENRKQG